MLNRSQLPRVLCLRPLWNGTLSSILRSSTHKPTVHRPISCSHGPVQTTRRVLRRRWSETLLSRRTKRNTASTFCSVETWVAAALNFLNAHVLYLLAFKSIYFCFFIVWLFVPVVLLLIIDLFCFRLRCCKFFEVGWICSSFVPFHY